MMIETGGITIETQLRVHDLLRLSDPASIRFNGAVPSWTQAQPRSDLWVVVRRAASSRGWCAAGLRGTLRSERCAIWVAERCIVQLVTPENLAVRGDWNLRVRARRAAIPAIAALLDVAMLMRDLEPHLSWGPTGSVGLELASGEPWATASSDLDLILRADQPILKPHALALYHRLSQHQARVDLLLETPAGAVALADWALQDGPCLLRTCTGPRLVANPWASCVSNGS